MVIKILYTVLGVKITGEQFRELARKLLTKDELKNACEYTELHRGEMVMIREAYDENLQIREDDEDTSDEEYHISPEHLLFNKRIADPLKKALNDWGLTILQCTHDTKNHGHAVVGKIVSVVEFGNATEDRSFSYRQPIFDLTCVGISGDIMYHTITDGCCCCI